ncbi:hypothetical protein A3K63_04545 [Candidatus Micrarchaeota archaeon RBG_16_49_10]|nr:MAG: hypothetical protein A3K63_04545 [Candidatus Micrarchaeota archaeon RBG_16_49_10]
MSDKETIDMLIEGGSAKPGPTTAPKLGMYKVNMKKLFEDINDQTKAYKDMSVPVKVLVDKKDGSYAIRIGTPPVSSLLAKELGMKKIAVAKAEKAEGEAAAEKPAKKAKEAAPAEPVKEAAAADATDAAGAPVAKKKKEKEKIARVIVADVKMQQLVKIARMKWSGMLSKTFKSAVKEVVGSCASMPVTIEGKAPKAIIAEIDEGKYDSLIKE